MRSALIAILVLMAGSAVAANANPFKEELAKREGFVCGRDFLTMRYTGADDIAHVGTGTMDMVDLVTIPKEAIREVWTWKDTRTSTIWLKRVGKSPSRSIGLSTSTSILLRQCLEND